MESLKEAQYYRLPRGYASRNDEVVTAMQESHNDTM